MVTKNVKKLTQVDKFEPENVTIVTDLATTKQVCAMLGVNDWMLKRYRSSMGLPYIFIPSEVGSHGAVLRYKKEAIQLWAAARGHPFYDIDIEYDLDDLHGIGFFDEEMQAVLRGEEPLIPELTNFDAAILPPFAVKERNEELMRRTGETFEDIEEDGGYPTVQIRPRKLRFDDGTAISKVSKKPNTRRHGRPEKKGDGPLG